MRISLPRLPRFFLLFGRGASRAVLLLAAVSVTARAADTTPDTNASASKPAFKMTDLFGDPVVARGKGLEIKRSQLDDAVVSVRSSYAANKQEIPPEQMPLVEQTVLDRLIQMRLLLGRATDADKARGKEDTAKRFNEVRTRAGSDETLARQLRSIGLTPEELQRKMLDETTAEAVLERELKLNVTDADVKKFYDDNPAQFEAPEMVRVSHILLSTKDPADTTPDPSMKRDLPEDQKKAKRKQIDDLLKRARNGEDFTKLAKEYSEDPGVKQNDGEYKFSRDDRFVPEFKAAAFSLSSNQISDVVTTMYGYHILKLNEKIPAQQVALTNVSTRIKNYLLQQDIAKLAPAYFVKLKKDAGVEILDEKLKLPETPGMPLPGAPAPAATAPASTATPAAR